MRGIVHLLRLMLIVDLGQLARQGRLAIEDDVPPDDPMWEGSGIALDAPLAVRLEVRQVGEDILVHGRLAGALEYQCRRCLERVVVRVDEPVSFTYRRGLEPVEAELEEAYALPERARELDLTDAVREHLVLAVPQFVICREACRGLCPQCGTNWNVGTCSCEVVDTDDRWAPLRGLKHD